MNLHSEMAAVADAPVGEQLAYARDLIRRVADLPAAGRQEYRDALRTIVPAVTKADFEAIVREERKALAVKSRNAAAAQRRRELEALRESAPGGGQLLPPPSDPLAAARALVERIDTTDGVPHCAWWRGDFYAWTGMNWAGQQDTAMRRWLYLQTEHALCEDDDGIERWAPNAPKISHLMEAIGPVVLARPWGEEEERCVATTNGALARNGRRTLHPHSPRRFNLTVLPFAYDAKARCPQWLKFLGQVLPGDDEAIAFLGEWFGYVVSGRTDLQKMADLFGAPRSGKGTIVRVLSALLGPESVAAPSLSSLVQPFGEQPLIGKSLAVLSDANWGIRDIAEAVEVLKSISGEDSRDVNRKNREVWHGQLGVRFMLLGNDMPKFTDASGALASRMIHIGFGVSFIGREDPALTGKLLTELPGILNWALDGLDRLTRRGRFVQPKSSEATANEILRLTSPAFGFVEDKATYDPEAPPVLLDDLFAVYREWCAGEEGRDRASTKSVFSRDLRSIGNGRIRIERQEIDKVRAQRVYGLAPQKDGDFRPRQHWLGSAS